MLKRNVCKQRELSFDWIEREISPTLNESFFVISCQNAQLPQQFQAPVPPNETIRWVRHWPREEFRDFEALSPIMQIESAWVLELFDNQQWQPNGDARLEDSEMTAIASTLEQLQVLVNLFLFQHNGCELPTFGGDRPTDTSKICSWDEERLLLREDTHQIVNRLSYLYNDVHKKMSDNELIGFMRAIANEDRLWDARLFAKCIEHIPTRETFYTELTRLIEKRHNA